jgi:hypothetical protein
MPIANDMQAALRALANERRVRILDWLKDPRPISRGKSTATWWRTGCAAS